jgi:Zn-dependent protease with chaperone function
MENLTNFDEKYYDLFPGLSKSNEVYFGRDANLSKLLMTHSANLKAIIGDRSEYNDKKFLAALYKEVTAFNNNIAKELNAERVQLCIVPDETNNASAYPLFYRSDVCTTKLENGKQVRYLDFDKVAEVEDIVIIPNVGYKYRTAKGKILILTINTGLIKNCSVEAIAASLAHELGHCFQDGIFGTYKDLADTFIGTQVHMAALASFPITSAFPTIGIINILGYIFFPAQLIRGVFNFISLQFAKMYVNIFKKVNDEKTYLMKDQLRRLDNGESKDLLTDYGNDTLAQAQIQLAATQTENRDLLADKIENENKSKMKSYTNKNKKTYLEKSTNAIYNLLRSITVDINIITAAGLRVLNLSTYKANKLNDMAFLKKYEFFADIFATSYGFGPDLYKDLVDSQSQQINSILEKDLVGINNISLFKAGYLNFRYKEIRNVYNWDVHGTCNDRGKAMYTALMKELDSNRTLTTSQKEEIKASIKAIQDADEAYYADKKQNDGFWFKYYNELIDDRIKGKDIQTEECILEPIEKIVKESMNKTKVKKI